MVEKSLEDVAIKTVETIVSGYPQGTLAVLAKFVDEAAGETVGRNKLAGLGKNFQARQNTCNQKKSVSFQCWFLGNG